MILSDGEDNSSHSSLKQSIQAAERAGVTVYSVSTREDKGDKTDADRVLEVLAERSGGEAMFPGDMMTLSKSFDKLHDLIRSRYFVAYKPANFQPNGSYRAISVTAEKERQSPPSSGPQGLPRAPGSGPQLSAAGWPDAHVAKPEFLRHRFAGFLRPRTLVPAHVYRRHRIKITLA